ncbi:MAG: hypothetical protein ACLQU4_19375 [Limisphaerales bacterium]
MKKERDDSTSSHQEAMAEVRRVVTEAKELSQAADGALTDKLAIWTAGRYAIATRQLAAKSRNGGVDWGLLRALCHDLVDLRRGDHSAESLRIERERLEMKREEKKEDLEKLCREWAKENQERICEGFMTRKQKIDELRRVMFGELPDDERAAIVNKVDEIMGLSTHKEERNNENRTPEDSNDCYSI